MESDMALPPYAWAQRERGGVAAPRKWTGSKHSTACRGGSAAKAICREVRRAWRRRGGGALRASRYHADLTMTNSRNGSQDGKRRADRSGTQADEGTRGGRCGFT